MNRLLALLRKKLHRRNFNDIDSNMKPFLCYLSGPQKRELQRLAKKYERSIAEMVRRAVDLYIEQQTRLLSHEQEPQTEE